MVIKGRPLWDKERIKTLLLSDPRAVQRGTIAIYQLQTLEEQNHGVTVERNGIGFNAFDAEYMTQMAEKFINKRPYTDKQFNACRKILLKYAGQLARIANKEI